jgi:hypothetical protein
MFFIDKTYDIILHKNKIKTKWKMTCLIHIKLVKYTR